MNTEQTTHAEQHAAAQAARIVALYRAHTALDAGAEVVTVDGTEYTSSDDVRQHAEESVLEVSVRGDWHSPGDNERAKPTEYLVLLSWGGPACRIVGALDQYGQPDGATIQAQDWGTPWTDCTPDEVDDDYDDALVWFVGCFYFGE